MTKLEEAKSQFKKAILKALSEIDATAYGGSDTPEAIPTSKKNKQGKKKPLPLNPKGGGGKGTKKGDPGVRGKTVNTSRSTGEEGAKADANADAFNKLMKSMSKRR